MILKHYKYLSPKFIRSLWHLGKKQFAQPAKKRTQAPKTLKNKNKPQIDPRNIDYNVVPQDIRKGVKAYVEATNMLVTSEAQLEQMSLRTVIVEERQKMMQTLQSQQQIQKGNQRFLMTEKKQKKQEKQEKNYDIASSLKFFNNVANALLVTNIVAFAAFNVLKKHDYLGFFLGVSLNPSLIVLTSLGIGYNCASWVIRHSLHLQISEVKDLTLEKISLTKCSTLMAIQAGAIALSMAGLSYYLMMPEVFKNMPYMMFTVCLTQSHTILNLFRLTRGVNFDLFSKLLFNQVFGTFLIGYLTYWLFEKIDKIQTKEQTNNQREIHERQQLKKGYEKFLAEFKTGVFEVKAGEAINKITIN